MAERRISECANCGLTFWGWDSSFCRRRDCQSARLVASMPPDVQRAVAGALAERELPRLIDEQAYIMRWGQYTEREFPGTWTVALAPHHE